MAMTVDELRQQLTLDTYTPKTDEQMRAEAEQRYASQYNQNRLTAQQTYERTDQALSNQLASLGQSYDKLRQQTEKSVRSSVSNLDRYSLQRGMQRSSYNTASIANIYAEGNQTLAEIGQNEANARNDLEGQRTQLANQLAAQLGQYDTDYANDVQAYFDQLKAKDEADKVEGDKYRNQLLMALYEYDQKAGASSGGGGSGGGGSGNTNNVNIDLDATGQSPFSSNQQTAYDKLQSMLSTVSVPKAKTPTTQSTGGNQNLANYKASDPVKKVFNKTTRGSYDNLRTIAMK